VKKHKAATTIQAGVRGRAARKSVAAIKLANEDVSPEMLRSTFEFLQDHGHLFSSVSSLDVTGGYLSAFIVMCGGKQLEILERLDHGGNVFDSWADMVVMAKDVLDGGQDFKVTMEGRIAICEFLMRSECGLIASPDKSRLEHFAKGLPASVGEMTDQEVMEALNGIIEAGTGVDCTEKVLTMMLNSDLLDLSLRELANDVRLASRFLLNPDTESLDVERLVEFLQASSILAANFELEYGDLTHLIEKTLSVEGCMMRLRLLERKGAKFGSYAELEAGVVPVHLPTKATRQLLSERLMTLHLECADEKLDELLLLGGSFSEVAIFLDQLPASGTLRAKAIEDLLNAAPHK
jgi:hypothetical protein